jgi:hypothetical protein
MFPCFEIEACGVTKFLPKSGVLTASSLSNTGGRKLLAVRVIAMHRRIALSESRAVPEMESDIGLNGGLLQT